MLVKVLLLVYSAVVTVLYLLERSAHTSITEAPTIPSADTLKAFMYRMFDEGVKEVEIKIKNPRFM